ARTRRPSPGREVEELQLAATGVLPDQERACAGVIERRTLELRVVARDDVLEARRPSAGEFDAREARKLATVVGIDPHRAIGSELRAKEQGLALMRREVRLVAAPQVDQVHVGIASRHRADEERGAAIATDIGERRDPGPPGYRSPLATRDVDGERVEARWIVPAGREVQRASIA